jgi:hypothetical protein
MTELLIWLVAGTFILAVFYAALPFILMCAGIAVTAWCLSLLVEAVSRRVRGIRASRRALIDRANEQHRLIMDGDEDAGTYGNYPPSM